MNMKLINLNFNEGGEKMRLKPVTIKDFKVGQKIAVLILHHGRNKEPELYERTVSRIGRKYVVDDRGTRYCQESYLKEGLVESSESVSYTHLDVYKRQILRRGSHLVNQVFNYLFFHIYVKT